MRTAPALRTLALAALATLATFAAASPASAEPVKLHMSTDIVTWDSALTQAQCLDKAKAAIVAADSKLTTVTATHAWVGTKDNWVVSVDCLQSYKVNAAYVTLVFNGAGTDGSAKVKAALFKALGGHAEMAK